MEDKILNVNVNIDLKSFDPLALEITKSYLELNSSNNFSSPKDFTGSFIIAYSRILAELELIRQNKELTKSLVQKAMELNFSQYEHNED